MSIVIPKFDRSVVVRGAAAEVVGTQCGARVGTRANTSAGIPNGGALSTVHVTVEKCADGARAWARISAERGSGAEILIVIAPGVERFEYFRQLTRIAQGQQPPESLRDVQDLYDAYFLNSPEWERANARV
jgi:hypothetical protein